MPPLCLKEVAGQCELSLAGWATGRGESLQAAGDNLVANLLVLARRVRDTNVVVSSEMPRLDLRMLELMDELLCIAADGGDVRARVFGAADRAA